MEPILVAKDVEKIYKNLAGEEFYALNHVSMEITRTFRLRKDNHAEYDECIRSTGQGCDHL